MKCKRITAHQFKTSCYPYAIHYWKRSTRYHGLSSRSYAFDTLGELLLFVVEHKIHISTHCYDVAHYGLPVLFWR